jgi:hypothetical protein
MGSGTNLPFSGKIRSKGIGKMGTGLTPDILDTCTSVQIYCLRQCPVRRHRQHRAWDGVCRKRYVASGRHALTQIRDAIVAYLQRWQHVISSKAFYTLASWAATRSSATRAWMTRSTRSWQS